MRLLPAEHVRRVASSDIKGGKADKRGVCPSVCPSVTLQYYGQMVEWIKPYATRRLSVLSVTLVYCGQMVGRNLEWR